MVDPIIPVRGWATYARSPGARDASTRARALPSGRATGDSASPPHERTRLGQDWLAAAATCELEELLVVLSSLRRLSRCPRRSRCTENAVVQIRIPHQRLPVG